MTLKRKISVHVLATIAFIALFLLPMTGFMAKEANAVQTAESMTSNGDYVFFVVQNEEVPLAAAPAGDVSSYILWVALAALLITISFIYSAWYMTMRRNINELSYKLTPAERRAIQLSQSFFHPIKCRRLARETEATIASMYINI